MPRKRELTPEVVADIRRRRRSGVPLSELEKEFGFSRGSIVNALKPKAKAAPARKGKRGAKAAAADAPPDPIAIPEVAEGTCQHCGRSDDENGRALRVLNRNADVIEAMLKKMAETGDVVATDRLLRSLSALTAQVAKMTPPPADDPDASPDMVAAAERAREKLLEVARRRRAEREAQT